MWIRRMAVGALALSTACSSLAPGNVSGAVDMVVVTYDPAVGKYVLKTQELSTLKKLRTLEGDAAKIELGAKLSVDLAAIRQANPATTDAFQKQIFASAGEAPDFDYFVSEGVVQPADADALALATTYYNFESAHLLFTGLGVTLPPARVAYDPSVTGELSGKLSPLTDSVVSQPYLRAFAVPKSTSNDVPAGLQQGVVAHQYSHAVFQSQVFPGEALPWLEGKLTTDTTSYRTPDNIVRGIDEGIADYFGAWLAKDATFIRTAPGKPVEDRRLDPATVHCAPTDLITNIQSQGRAQYDPYVLGSLISRLLWDLYTGTSKDEDALHASIIKWEKELGVRLTKNLASQTLPDALDAMVASLTESFKPRACGLIFDRFRLTKADVPTCTVVHTAEKKCAL